MSPRLRKRLGIIPLLLACAACRQETPATSALRPLIIVPGMVGSELSEKGPDGHETQLWGGHMLFTPGRLARLAMKRESWNEKGEVEASALVERFEVVPFVFRVPMYGPLLKALERSGAYALGRNLIPYPYDWRRDIEDEARRLREWLATQAPREADLLAVSNGGMLVLQALADAPLPGLKIHQLYLVATPLQGSPVAQRLFQLPRRRGLKISAFVPQDVLASIRSLYSLLPERRLRKVEHSFLRPDFTYKEVWSDGSPSRELAWMDPAVEALVPAISSEGLKRAAAWRERWRKGHSFANVEHALVIGSACEETFGLPGDNTVLAESVEATAALFKTRPFWICERHERIQNAPALIETLIRNSQAL